LIISWLQIGWFWDYFCFISLFLSNTPKMLRAFLVILGLMILLSACTQKMVCPAYQSAFIYDKDELRKKFSYFKEDSTPKLATVSKTKYLIAEPTTYRQKTRSLQTVEAKPILPIVPDSLLMSDSAAIAADLDKAARSVIDSTYIVDTEGAVVDSLGTDKEYMISIDREVRVLKYNSADSLKYDPGTGQYIRKKPSYSIKEVGFNVDQGNYLWYLRDVLVLPDVRIAKQREEAKAKEETKKKGIKGFFGNLFKKKSKADDQEIPEQTISPDLDEYNFDEFDDVPRDTASQTGTQTVKKKGLKSRLKKDKAPKQAKQPKPKKEVSTPAKKEEEEDDGF